MHIDDIGTEPFSRNFEAEQRARRIFEERIDLRQPGKPLVGFGMRAVRRDPAFRFIEQEHDLVRLQPVDPGQMPVGERRRRPR